MIVQCKVFSRETLNFGGRLKESRRWTTLNQPLCECDYKKCIHATLQRKQEIILLTWKTVFKGYRLRTNRFRIFIYESIYQLILEQSTQKILIILSGSGQFSIVLIEKLINSLRTIKTDLEFLNIEISFNKTRQVITQMGFRSFLIRKGIK